MANNHGGHVILRSGANQLNSGSQKNGGDIILETGGAANAVTERMRFSDLGVLTLPTINSSGTNRLLNISAAGVVSTSAIDPANVGTVTTVSVTTANGVSGTVATATTTPAITLTLGAITPSSVAATGTVTGSNLSGTNTGDQTITLTSDVTGSGTGSFATTIASGAVTTGKILNGTIINEDIANGTIDLTQKVTGLLPIANGGTNSSTALSNNRVMVSSAGAIVENAALTANLPVFATATGLTTTAPATGVQGYWTRTGTFLHNTTLTDNVGIGTASPSSKFHVSNSTAYSPPTNALSALLVQGSFGGGILMQDGSKYGGMYMVSSGADMRFNMKGTAASNTDIMTLNEGGNVGIGNTAPDHLLSLTKTHTSGTTFNMLKANYDDNWGLRLVQNYAGAGDIKYEFKEIYSGTTYDVLAFRAGSVGIGTTTPGTHGLMVAKIGNGNATTLRVEQPGTNSWGHVAMLRTATGSDGAKLLFNSRNTKNWSIGGVPNSNDFEISEDGGDGVIGTGFGTSRFYVKAGGNVGIGTTNPGYALEVNGVIAGRGGDNTDPTLNNVHAQGLLQHHDGNSGYAPVTWHQTVLGDNAAWGGNYQRLYLRRGDNSYTNEITVALADGTTSSRALKKNITPIPSQDFKRMLDEINAIELVTYEFINDPNHLEGYKHVGFIAEDLPADLQMPNGQGLELGDGFAYLFAAIKVLKAENDALKAALEEVKRSISK